MPPVPASSVREMEEGPGEDQVRLELEESNFESIEGEGQMDEMLAKLNEVVMGQAETQRQMA